MGYLNFLDYDNHHVDRDVVNSLVYKRGTVRAKISKILIDVNPTLAKKLKIATYQSSFT